MCHCVHQSLAQAIDRVLVEAHAVGGDLEGQKQIVAAMAGAAGLRAVNGNVMRFVRPSSSPTVGAGMVPTAVAPLISMLTPTLKTLRG